MIQLNCGIGDLAITVNTQLPENCGTIVRVVSAVGLDTWLEHDGLLYVWNVEVATEEGLLHYQYGQKIKTKKTGPVPDQCLRRLTPPQGYLMDEFADCEQVCLDLLLDDLVEADIDV